MATLGKLLIIAIFGSCATIAVGVVLWLNPEYRLRGEKFMRAGATAALAIMFGLIAFNVAVRREAPTWENAVKIFAAVTILVGVPLWKRHRKRTTK